MNRISLAEIRKVVDCALSEDLGNGDVTAELIPAETRGRAIVICREQAVLCGQAWVEELYRSIDPELNLHWLAVEGAQLAPDQAFLQLDGRARSILTGERTALNILQTLSATATAARRCSRLIAHTRARLLDTRKTLPGLRAAQKYAVRLGGGSNHRMGLYDAFLIKENHIAACGSLTRAIDDARRLRPGLLVEVEVETEAEFEEALGALPDVIMLDNFDLPRMRAAASRILALRSHGDPAGHIKLEASGGIEDDAALVRIAETGVDFVSVGALTKHCRAVDLSMRFSAGSG